MSLVTKVREKREKMEKDVAMGICLAKNALMEVDKEKVKRIKKNTLMVYNMALLGIATTSMLVTFAATEDPATSVMKKMIDIICKVFRYVGVILAVYSIGQLVLAFKNEDADSKSRATTMLVISAILIGIKPLIDQLNLESYLN